MSNPKSPCGARVDAKRHCFGVVSVLNRTIGSALSSGADQSYFGEGHGAGGLAVPGVDPDPIADPEGPAGIEGELADWIPAGTPRGSMGPKGAPEGAEGPKILCIAAQNSLSWEGVALEPGNSWYAGLGPGSAGGVRERGLEARAYEECLNNFLCFLD